MTSKVGRPARPIEWKSIEYHGNIYSVGKIKFNDNTINCVIDSSDLPQVLNYNWHVVTGSYIGCYKMYEGKKKTLYLHNFIMGRDQS